VFRNRHVQAALAIAIMLVIARSFVYAAYEQSHFDSDQAIVGLMAKHLSEGRAFPLFFYGQSFMLGVEAWLAVPFFWIAGPTVAALRASLILTNIGVVTLLVVGLVRWGGLRPFWALAASAFFALAPPVTAARLVEAQGGNVEPFFYVLALWWLKARPMWFGAVLGIGFLNREFTIYAVPVLIAGQIWWRRYSGAAFARYWLLAAVVFFLVWQGIQALEPLADMAGPGTRGQLLGGFAGSQVGNLANRVHISPMDVPGRLWFVASELVPLLIGGRSLTDAIGQQGRDWVLWPMATFAAVGLARIAWLAVVESGRQRLQSAAFAFYVLGVGVMAVIAFAVTRPAGDATLRYMLLAVFVPVGLTAVWLALESRAWIRRAVVAVVLGWAVLSGVDNARQAARYVSAGVPNPLRQLVGALAERGVRVAEAPYLRAYKLTFLSQERVKVSSTDVTRISEYQRLANEAGPGLIRIQEEPCPGEQVVPGWFLCRSQ
jgi:hypothetical protein